MFITDTLRAVSFAIFTFCRQDYLRISHMQRLTHLLSPIKYLFYILPWNESKEKLSIKLSQDRLVTVSIPNSIVLAHIISLSFLEDVFCLFILTDQLGNNNSQLSITSISRISPKFPSSGPPFSTIGGRDKGLGTFP